MADRTIIDSLIYDRTQADVDYALLFERGSVHVSEDLKGAYNVSDRNRVGAAVNYISDLLRDIGYYIFSVAKSNWTVTDIAKPEDGANLLKTMEYIKKSLLYSDDLPANMDGLTYQKANDIERILFEFYGIYEMLMYFRAGDGYASGFDSLDSQVFDDNINYNFTLKNN